MAEIRPATAADHAAIARITTAAFEGEGEAGIIERLRADGEVVAELVAVEAGEVVGHILFSRLPVVAEDGKAVETAALAPMAVAPGRQRSGFGSALVTAGLDACRALAVPAVIVLGHEGFYPRFGFSAAAAAHLDTPFPGPHFMAIELVPGALSRGGRVVYPRAFGL